MIERIPEVSVLKLILLSEILEQLAARLSLIRIFIHGDVNGLPYKEVVEYLPSLLLDFFREEVGQLTRIEVRVVLLDQGLRA